MIVIAKKSTGKLIGGYRYEVVSLKNSGTNRWGEGTVTLKDIGTFNVSHFTDTNGNPVDKRDILKERKEFKFEDIKKGDILVCERNQYKGLVPGNMYKIVDLKTTTKTEKDWQGKDRVRVTKFIKLEGHRFIQFNSYAFRMLNSNEIREISLSKVLDNEVFDYSVDTSVRMIDTVKEKDLELMKILSRAIIDSKRHHLGVVDWACSKINHRMDINPKDFDNLLNMSLKDILEKIKQD